MNENGVRIGPWVASKDRLRRQTPWKARDGVPRAGVDGRRTSGMWLSRNQGRMHFKRQHGKAQKCLVEITEIHSFIWQIYTEHLLLCQAHQYQIQSKQNRQNPLPSRIYILDAGQGGDLGEDCLSDWQMALCWRVSGKVKMMGQGVCR